MPIFARLKSPTIAHRLIVSIVLFSSCFTFLFTGLQLYAGYRFDLRQIDDNFDLIEQGYLDVIANSLWAFDQKQLELVLQGMLSSSHIHQVTVEANGISTNVGSESAGDILTKQYQISYMRDGSAIELGVLRVTANLEGVYDRLLEQLWVTLASNAFKTFAVSIFIFLLFQHLVTRRLDRISAYTRELDCQSALNFDPLSASNIDPSCGTEKVVQVVNRGDPRGFV